MNNFIKRLTNSIYGKYNIDENVRNYINFLNFQPEDDSEDEFLKFIKYTGDENIIISEIKDIKKFTFYFSDLSHRFCVSYKGDVGTVSLKNIKYLERGCKENRELNKHNKMLFNKIKQQFFKEAQHPRIQNIQDKESQEIYDYLFSKLTIDQQLLIKIK